jgi:hypothetical protein
VNHDDRNVFAWLDNIRARPAMYLRNNSLQELEYLVWGYYAALYIHGIVEAVPHMTRHFRAWLYYRNGWSQSLGWAAAFDRTHSGPEQRLASFFSFVDEYRALTLTRICTVKLAAEHNPTGKRVEYGFDGLMEKPLRVDIVRYRPEPLHFLRFHYRGRAVDDDLLMTGKGEYNTNVAFAKRWVRDELQVKLRDWEKLHA